MMDKFSLVYIDDAPDTALTKYLDKDFHSDKFEVTFSEIIFNPKNGYQSLLNDAKVQISFLLILVFLKLVPQRKNLQVKNLNLYSKNFTRLLRL